MIFKEKVFSGSNFIVLFLLLCEIWLCIRPGIQERGTECGERGEWGECYIPGNVAKYSGECHKTFRGMSPNIPGNVGKHSGECHQTFRGMSQNIPGNVIKNSGERRQTFQGMLPIFVVKGRVAFIILSNIHDGALLRK